MFLMASYEYAKMIGKADLGVWFNLYTESALMNYIQCNLSIICCSRAPRFYSPRRDTTQNNIPLWPNSSTEIHHPI